MFRSLWSELKARQYARNEQGSILVFVMVVFSAMFLVGGTAVDLARHESLRTSLQYNLDRAVLAAASLRQTETPETIVNDYMGKIRAIESFTLTVNSTVGTNSRTVSATADTELNTWFLRLAGINKMPIRASSAASERIPNLEISLVLDMSGSMGNNNKLENLQTAAKEFVTTMLASADPDTISISIIPFSSSVSPPEGIYESLLVDETHTAARCIRFADEDYSERALDPTDPQEQVIFTSRYGTNWDLTGSGFNQDWRSCRTEDAAQILPYSDNETELHNMIDALTAEGSTSGDMGMKWANALLDPEFQPVVDNLIARGEVNENLTHTPVAYDDADTMKVIILMGDGSNFRQRQFTEDYKTGASDLYSVVRDLDSVFTHLTYYGTTYTGAGYEVYCGYVGITCHYSDPEPEEMFYLKATNGLNYYDVANSSWITAAAFDLLDTTLEGFQSKTQMTWADAWAHTSPNWITGVTGNNSLESNWDSGAAVRQTAKLNTLMHASCDEARDAGTVVYTIGFETNDAADTALLTCATSASHFYQAAGTQISSVFSSIAGNIQTLKLTQ